MIKLGSKYPFDARSSATVVLLSGEVTVVRVNLVQLRQKHRSKDESVQTSMLWGGYSGAFKLSDKDIFNTAKRVLFEKSGGFRVYKNGLVLVAVVKVFNPGNTTQVHDREVFLFTTYKHRGEPRKTKKIGLPKLFSARSIPFNEMDPSDEVILRSAMSGKATQGCIYLVKNSKGIVEVDKSRTRLRVSPTRKTRWL